MSEPFIPLTDITEWLDDCYPSHASDADNEKALELMKAAQDMARYLENLLLQSSQFTIPDRHGLKDALTKWKTAARKTTKEYIGAEISEAMR